MSPDKEQVRREPRTYMIYLSGSHRLSSRRETAVLKADYDAVLAELEQAEEKTREQHHELNAYQLAQEIDEARLAGVSVLVAALREIKERGEDTASEYFNGYLADIAANALTEWESEPSPCAPSKPRPSSTG